MGLNCFNCHSGTGTGNGCFALAGTVYIDSLGTQTLSNATIKLYSQPDGAGQLLKTIEVDEMGNFYDGSEEGLVGSYYPVVVSSNGSIRKMLEPISKGDCNRCHGVSTNKIWVN